jgi:hypothetical protein
MAGSDITASPSQLVARTTTRDIADGLKSTGSSVAGGNSKLLFNAF